MEYPVYLKGVQKSDNTAFVNIISRRNYKLKVRCSPKSDANVIVFFIRNQTREIQLRNQSLFHTWTSENVKFRMRIFSTVFLSHMQHTQETVHFCLLDYNLCFWHIGLIWHNADFVLSSSVTRLSSHMHSCWVMLGEVVVPDVVLVDFNPCSDIQMLAFF